MTEIKAICGDITEDHGMMAIVNAANTSLLGGGGVDGAIHRAAGPELLEECKTLNGCPTGQAKLTKGYNLPAAYVIHTPGPRWRGGNEQERELLEDSYWNCLQVALDHQISSVAFPSISTGIYHFPLREASMIAISTVKRFVDHNPDAFSQILFVLFDDKTRHMYDKAIHQVCSAESVS